MSAKYMFYPEDKLFSRAEERAYAREKLIYNVMEDILVELENREITKKELARRLGKSRSYITQILSGRNLTLGSLSDMCFAIGIKPRFSYANDGESLVLEAQEFGEWNTGNNEPSLDVSALSVIRPIMTLVINNTKPNIIYEEAA